MSCSRPSQLRRHHPRHRSTDRSEGTVSVSSLTFTPANWKTPQPVVITGVNDSFADGDIAYTIVLGYRPERRPRLQRAQSDRRVGNQHRRRHRHDHVHQDRERGDSRPRYLYVEPGHRATGRILDLDVRVNITHDWDEDLDVFLIAPDGTRTELFTDVGSSAPTSPIPFSTTRPRPRSPLVRPRSPARYRPEGNLTSLEGKNVTGHLEAGSQG